MHTFFKYFQLILSLLLILLILTQERASGLSLSLGGMGHVYHSKRGAEKVIATATVIVAILFVGCSVALLFV